MSLPPIKITIYKGKPDQPSEDFDPNEIKREYSTPIIPWGVLKKAASLTQSLDQENVTEEDMDNISALIVEAFMHQFTAQDLEAGADFGEMLTVLQAIVTRASSLVKANPTRKPASVR